jgi:hypothetical protein
LADESRQKYTSKSAARDQDPDQGSRGSDLRCDRGQGGDDGCAPKRGQRAAASTSATAWKKAIVTLVPGQSINLFNL